VTRNVNPALPPQHAPILAIIRKPALVSAPFRVAYRDARVVHGDPRAVRSTHVFNDIALGWRLRVSPLVPVRDFVFTIVSRVRNDPVDMLPALLEPRLQG